MIYILGGSGFIGKHLAQALKKSGEELCATYFKHQIPGLVPYDMTEPVLPPPGASPSQISHLVIAAASTTRIDSVKADWDRIYQTDVKNVHQILDFCSAQNIVPVYFSTDFVFNGRAGHYAEADPRDPVNGYGKIKILVEEYIEAHFRQYLIFRSGKVFGTDPSDNTLLTEIISGLDQGKLLHCAVDQIFTPVCVTEFAGFAADCIRRKRTGVFHVASTLKMSRYDLAVLVKKHCRISTGSIEPCRINELGLAEERPLNIDLDVSKYRALSGLSAHPVEYYLDEIIEKKGNYCESGKQG